jgi:hypothetical protein
VKIYVCEGRGGGPRLEEVQERAPGIYRPCISVFPTLEGVDTTLETARYRYIPGSEVNVQPASVYKRV